MILYSLICAFTAAIAAEAQNLAGTKLLTMEGDLAVEMVAGIDKFLMREIETSVERRAKYWKRDFSSPENYVKSVELNRQRFLKIIGAIDPREHEVPGSGNLIVGEGNGYKIFPLRWGVLKGVEGEGLLLEPDKEAVANVVALPDCDWTPEVLAGLTDELPDIAQFARRLAESGCRVLIPMLIDRKDTYSGILGVRMTDQPHREFIYRAAYELGRHIIGYEVQKVMAAIDWLAEGAIKPIGVIGYGEGGLIAFYAAASDVRIDAAAVCGYFQRRESLWKEPIYRNVFGLLEEFGDAEIASLIAPRALIVEACKHPEVSGPPASSPGRSGAAPGVLTTPSIEEVEAEFQRAKKLTERLDFSYPLTLVKSDDGKGLPGSEATLEAFLRSLGAKSGRTMPLMPLMPLTALSALSTESPKKYRQAFNPQERLKRQFNQLLEHTQHIMREAEYRRVEFWSKADSSSADKWKQSCQQYREYFWSEVIGRFPPASLPVNPRTRLVYDEPKFRGYEVVLDVYPDVFAYGILLLPKDIKEGEQRPVVVCQHGLEGRPQDVANPAVDNPAYHRYACGLAERGFITYAPQNPYIGGDNFRLLQRKANPLKKSLFSVIISQHKRLLGWLSTLPFVDSSRIAFYGLSYGGKTAMRVPAILEQYSLSICSADYNEWIWKNASARSRYSYLITGEYEMFEFDLGNTFNYAEMSWLICPRPFMVERGHHDGVAPDEWVAYEYAKTYRRYALMDLGDKTEIEFFNGPHTINGVGTFEFLHRHLKWPKP